MQKASRAREQPEPNVYPAGLITSRSRRDAALAILNDERFHEIVRAKVKEISESLPAGQLGQSAADVPEPRGGDVSTTGIVDLKDPVSDDSCPIGQ